MEHTLPCVYRNHKTNMCSINDSICSECVNTKNLLACSYYHPQLVPSNEDKNDQTIKADSGKPRLTLVPHQIIFDIAKVREYGLKKYGESESWKKVSAERYRDAAYRHFLAYLNDPYGVDAESGLPHLSHLACNVAFLCELDKEEKE